ncbi:LITAF domain-containing protein-like [Brevipalpus obovatus]|uniref:LITAF domain-containing protein-like n=1 Tax=Brevipalpus obovatus TaxID=246614 RepID=UPI003D9E0BCD
MAQQPMYPPINPPPYPVEPYSPGFKGEPDIPAPEPHDVTFGEEPMCVRCPHCNLTVESSISPETGKVTWLSSIGCFILGGIICFWIPFCWKCTRDVKHTCPRCGRELGFYRRC